MARVLVVDDSPVVRLTVSRALRAAGHEVILCESAAAAAALDPTGIDRALVDFDLGDGHGVDVARRLAGVRLAFFTSEEADPREGEARALGPIFAKPAGLTAALAWLEAG